MESSWMVQAEFPAGENMEIQREVEFLSQVWGTVKVNKLNYCPRQQF
jgi:hypothetical protein